MRMRCLFLAGAASLLVLSCGKTPEKEKPEAKPEITVPSESQAVFSSGLSFEAGPQVQTSKVSFTTTASWSADVTDTRASAWLSVQPASGAAGTVNMTVSAQPNTVEDARRATVTIKCGTVTKAFTVTQAGAPPSDIPVTSVTLDKERIDMVVGGTVTLTATVTPDDATDKIVTWSSTDATVISVDQKGTVTALKGGTATITAAAGDKSATAFVDVLEVTPGSVEIEGKGGRFDVSVITTRSYHISSKPDWVQELSVEKQVHHFEVPANDSDQERSGVISICDDEGTCLACLVKQAGFQQLEVDLDELFFDLNGGRQEVKVSSTMDWTVSSSENWCTVSPSGGSYDGVFTIFIGEFKTEGTRSAIVTLKGGDLARTIKILQEGIVPFSVTPTSVEFGESGGDFEVKVKSSFDYHLNGMPDWVSQVSVQNKTHIFQIAANPLEQERSGIISFCDDNGTCLAVSVKQAAHIPNPNDIDWNRDFYHRSLIMRFTATWCPHCPLMRQTVLRAMADYPDKLIHVAIHGYDSNLFSSSVSSLIHTYGIPAYPTGVVDGRIQIRNESVDIAAPKIIAAAKETESLYGTNTGIAVNSSLSGRKVSIHLTAYSKKAGNYKLTILLLEDGIITPQSGASGIFVHDDVARIVVTDARGDAFSLSQNQSYQSFSYSATIPEEYKIDNMKILAYIQDQNGSYIDNSLMAPIGKNIVVQQVSKLPGGGNEGLVTGDDINLH